jgi:hypothetical protein
VTTNNLRVLITGAAVIAIGICAETSKNPSRNDPATLAVEKGLKWLVSVQGNDGGWGQDGGETSYVRQGEHLESNGNDVANTVVAAEALLHAGNMPTSGEYRQALQRAVHFLLDHVERSPAEGLAVTDLTGTQIQRKLGPYIDTFLTSKLLAELDGNMGEARANARVRQSLEKCVAKVEKSQLKDGSWNLAGGWEKQVQRMSAYLRAQQFTEQNGWHVKDPVYGAWGMGGGRRTPPDTGHVDLSMTKYVLKALRAAGVPSSDRVFEQAQVFVERCQNFDAKHPEDADGGFFFSTTEFDSNKAVSDGKRLRSYGSTTSDGIIALLAIGRPPDDARIAAAKRWLTAHHRDMKVPGFVGAAYQRWPQGLMFYYSCASSEAFRSLHTDAGWALPLPCKACNARTVLGRTRKIL